jgi:hypothetical protein
LDLEETSFKQPVLKNLLENEQQKKNDLAFLLDQDAEEYGQELLESFNHQKESSLYEQYLDDPGVTAISNGGKNDFLQAVL